jgi:hypothetical protein
MHVQHIQHGVCLVECYATDMAVLALALRHASQAGDILGLNPVLSTTLDSLALTFEFAASLSLRQSGVEVALDRERLTGEHLQLWCEQAVQGERREAGGAERGREEVAAGEGSSVPSNGTRGTSAGGAA